MQMAHKHKKEHSASAEFGTHDEVMVICADDGPSLNAFALPF